MCCVSVHASLVSSRLVSSRLVSSRLSVCTPIARPDKIMPPGELPHHGWVTPMPRKGFDVCKTGGVSSQERCPPLLLWKPLRCHRARFPCLLGDEER